ncbi:MAG: type II toxin-antitoxin system VapC family toxin [Burkholderiales bacterium]
MKYLLDANTCIRLLNASSEEVMRRYKACVPADIALCSVVRAELLYGARRSARVELNLKRLKDFAEPLHTLSFDDRCANDYGLIRAALAAEGTPIGANDLMIAAIALAHDLILVTHNTGEFSRVAGLRLEDWELESPNS